MTPKACGLAHIPCAALVPVVALLLAVNSAPAGAQFDPLNNGIAIVSKLGARCLEMGPDPEGQLFAKPCRWGLRQQFHYPLGYRPGDTKGTFGVDYFGTWRCVLGMDGSRMPGDDALVLTTCYTNWPSNVWTFQNGTIRLTWNGECLTMPADAATETDSDGHVVWKDDVIIPTVEPCTGSDNQTWYRALYADYSDFDAPPMRNISANRVQTIVPYPASAIAGTKDGWGPMLDGWMSREEFAPRNFVRIKQPARVDAPALIVSDDLSKPVHVVLDWAGTAAAEPDNAPGCFAQPAGLTHWWGAEGAAHDMIGDRHGRASGATLVPGKVGLAFSFDGVDDYIDIPGTWDGSAMTISAWVKPGATSDDFQAVFSSTVRAAAHLQLNAGGNVAVYTDAGEVMLPIVQQAPTGTWRHLALAIGSGAVVLYVDGEEAGRSSATFSSITPSTGMRIGSGFDKGRFFNGLVDEVQVYERALSADEVKGISSAGEAGVCRK